MLGGGKGHQSFFFFQFVYLSLLYKTVVGGSIYHWKRDPVGGSKSRCRAAVLTQLAKGKVMKKQCWPSSRLWRNPPKTELFTHVSMFLWVLWQLTSVVVSLPFFCLVIFITSVAASNFTNLIYFSVSAVHPHSTLEEQLTVRWPGWLVIHHFILSHSRPHLHCRCFSFCFSLY